MTEDDPITLEPLRELDVQPFALTAGISAGPLATGTRHYFDPVALASYVTRRGVFENPLTREPLGRDDCVRLDEHLRRFVPGCRDFRVTDALDLQRAIRVQRSGDGGRSSTALRREATAALHGLFHFSSRGERGGAASEARGGWSVVDDDAERHEQAEAIAARYRAAAVAAGRPGGAPPDLGEEAFPELTEEARRLGELAAVSRQGEAFAQLAQAAAEEATREAAERAAEAEARREASREARERAEAARRVAVEAALGEERRRQDLQAKAKAAEEEKRRQQQRQQEVVWRQAERVTSEADAAASVSLQAEREAEVLRRQEEERQAELAVVATKEAEEEEERLRAERRLEKEADKKRRLKDKRKERKVEAQAEQAKQSAQEELEAAKRASEVKCGACGQGILGGQFFEAMDQKFCGTACVRKHRESK